MSNHRTYFIPGGAPFAIDVTLCMDGPGSCGPIVLDKPRKRCFLCLRSSLCVVSWSCAGVLTRMRGEAFVVKYGRAMSMMGGGCSVDMREFSMKHMIRHKKTGSLFQGARARSLM